MGSRLRQLRLLRFTVGLAVVAGAAILVSSALGSAFPGKNGKIVYAVYSNKADKLFTANADGSSRKQITKPGAKQQGDEQPRFSRDGKKVVFTRNPEQFGYNKTQIWIAPAAGGSAHRVVTKGLPKGASAEAPTFTPNGKSILFELDKNEAPAGIWKVSVGGGKATQVTDGNDYQPTVSPNGKKIAFMRAFTLVIANVNGSNPQTLYTPPDFVSSLGEPDFSPNGKTIAFNEYNTSTEVWDIVTVPAAGGSPTNLTNGTVYSSMDPAYSPDGTKILFTQISDATAGYGTSIAVMPAAGGDATTVVNAPKGGVVFSPDWGIKPVHHKHHRRHHH
jgi:Tol biopolymer transport system component